MASWLCIIASENSGFGSFANGENGYICNLTEYETIVKIFDKLYNNELLLLKHSKNTRNTVINNYSWEEYINRSLIFYKKIN